jgi:coproporphyrinogen III oxidase-like Fe-S oxidoreductase
MLKLKYFEKFFKALKKKFGFADNIEITIEANPENITKENLK